jgi:glycosyltransferase involved in cell wall biosynthesis
MKVLMYCWEFPPHISGGLGIACHGIVSGLLTNGLEVALVLPRSDRNSLSIECVTNLHILETQYLYEMIEPYPGKSQLNSLGSKFGYGHDILSVVKNYAIEAGFFSKTTQHDIIHAHDWLTILAGIEAKKISGKPLVFHVHALEIDRSAEPVNQTIFEIEKYGMMESDQIIAVSQYTKNRICQYYDVPADKIKVVYNGVFKEQIQHISEKQNLSSKYKTILFLARVTYQKAPMHFIEVAQKILSYRKCIQFVIAGSGDMLRSTIEKVAAFRLGTDIHFTKFMTREDCLRLYRVSDIYVMPSISEPFGLTCLEAIGQNIPVVISKQSGVSEVIHSALKADFWDIDKMVSHICDLIDSPALKNELTKNANNELQNLLWVNTAQQIAEIYQYHLSEH